MYYADQLFSNPSYWLRTGTEGPIFLLRAFPIFLMAILGLFLNILITGRIVVFLFSMIGIVFIYLIGTKVGNKFVGLCSMILLSFHHLYWFLSERVLMDVPITAMLTVFVYWLLRYEEKPFRYNLIALIVIGLITINTKKIGLIVLPMVFIYFFTRKVIQPLYKKHKTKFRYGSLYFTVFIVLLFILDKMFTFIFNRASIIAIINNLPFVLSWYVIIPLMVGFILLVYYRTRQNLILLLWPLLILLTLSVISNAGVPRYLLPLVPPVMIIVSLLIWEISGLIKLRTKFRYVHWILFPLIIFVSFNFYQAGENLIYSKSQSFVGYPEIGRWVRDNVPKESLIFTSMQRELRAFSGYEYKEFGGNIESFEFIKSKNEFENKVSKSLNNVYVVVDVWEIGYIKWLYPFDESKIQYLSSLGLELVEVIKVRISDREIPVGFVFRERYLR
jgi:hypothetical protein